jgi:hypothetical protein
MFSECKVGESCAGGQYGNLANLANHQAGGYTAVPPVHWDFPVAFYFLCPWWGCGRLLVDILGYVAPKSAYKKRSSQID